MKDTERHEIAFGRSMLPYSLRRSEKRMTIGIIVGKHEGVEVIAPLLASYEDVATAVRRKSRWIRQQIREFDRMDGPVAERQWMEGESLPYLGKNYRIHYEPSNHFDLLVRLKAGSFVITCPPEAIETNEIGKAIESWYKDHAKPIFETRISWYAKRLGLETPPVRIRKQAKRWGSCTAKGEVILNWQLASAPTTVIDYVLAHECVHLLERGHNGTFYQILGKLMPDYKIREKRLIREGPQYAIF